MSNSSNNTLFDEVARLIEGDPELAEEAGSLLKANDLEGLAEFVKTYHDCLERGHILEECEFDTNSLQWDGTKYDITAHPTYIGLACKYCGYVEEPDYDD